MTRSKARGGVDGTKRAVKIIRVTLGVTVLYFVVSMFLRYDSMSLASGDISMAPAIPPGKKFFVDTWAGGGFPSLFWPLALLSGGGEDPYEVGQIVLYQAHFENRLVLRLGRIVAAGGDVLTEKEDLLYRDLTNLQAAGSDVLPIGEEIPENSFIILVENPDLRLYPDPGFPDSRHNGLIPEERIVGRYILHF